MPAGDDVTTPPELTVTVRTAGLRLNVAVTFFAAFIVTAQLPVPVQLPAQPANSESAVGVGIRVTSVFAVKPAEHVAPQSSPEGLDDTLPVPVPFFITVKLKMLSVNVAVALVAWLTV